MNKIQEKPKDARKKTDDFARKEAEKRAAGLMLFGKWDNNVQVNDEGLKRYINLTPRIIPKASGVHQKNQFHKSKMHIVERLALHIIVSGHSSKKHKITSGKFGGGYQTTLRIVEEAFDGIAKKSGKNPVEVFVRALENAALCEEVAAYQVGGMTARQAVITSPQRRVDKALRLFAQGAYKDSFNKKNSIVDSLVNELMAAYEGSNKSLAIRERERIEQEAASSR